MAHHAHVRPTHWENRRRRPSPHSLRPGSQGHPGLL